jgi:hypothetical protein
MPRRRSFTALLLVLAHATLTLAADLDRGTVGHWRFDGSDGKTVRDLSPRHNDGVIQFGVLQTERGAASLEFDGIGTNVQIAEKARFGFDKSFSGAIWVKPFDAKNNTVLFGVPNPVDEWTTPVFGMYLSNGRVVYGHTAPKGKVLVESETELPLQTWTLLVGTYDGAAARLYVNAQRVAEQPYAQPLAMPGDRPLLIGMGRGAKPFFKGRVGELRLWDRALSADEVAALYQQTSGGYDLTPAPPPKHHDGTVIVESPGSNPNGASWRKYPTRLLGLLDGYHPLPTPPKLDRYGGLADQKEKATGFFHVATIDGRHWLIDPDGGRYFNVAINTVREPRGVAENFGSSEQWAQKATDELRGLGFNGLGNAESPALMKVERRLSWVRRHNFIFSFARSKKLVEAAAGTQGFPFHCPPVFHPDFEAHCERFAQALGDTADDPYLIGIMTDNEMQCPADLLDRCLALDPTNADLKPNRDAAEAWLTARKGSADPKLIDPHDRYEFIAFAFERYYRIVTAAIRKVDHNHLYLGSRINYHVGEFDNPWFWKVLAKYHDVVSVNYYGNWGPQAPQFAEWERWSGGTPILITEWYAKALDVPDLANTKGAGWTVRTQEDRARYYQHFVLNALELKTIVGVHFFKYLDDPKESTALDNAGGANKGMFDATGKPYEPLVKRASAVNHEVYPLIDFFDSRER